MAVLGVVMFHAFPSSLPGGFVGVDVFFVISGYLIARIIHGGLLVGRFRFQDFYVRRIRRLFPALITLLLVCLGYGWLVLFNSESQQIGKHAAAATLFIQNFVFWSEHGYWDVASALKPLLHLWTLAVEEQFYIVFPVLLLLCRLKKVPIVPVLWCLLMVSLAASLLVTPKHQEAAFFLPFCRAWEFLAGALLAVIYFETNSNHKYPHGNILSITGILFLLAGIFLLDHKNPYPGWRAIVPVAGSVALIAAGDRAVVNRWILSHPFMVWIGLISYPLYLFHWPALSFVHIINGGAISVATTLLALLIAALLAVGTYYWIERPLRFSRSRWILPVLVTSSLFVGSLGFLAWKNYIPTASAKALTKIQTAIDDRNFFSGWENYPLSDGMFAHKIGGEGDQILCVGDSNMWQYAPRIRLLIEAQARKTGMGAIMTAYTGCPPIEGVYNPKYTESKLLMASFREIIANDKRVTKVVFTSHWDAVFSRKYDFFFFNGVNLFEEKGMKESIDSFGNTIRELVQGGKKVYVILSVPHGTPFDPKNMIGRSFVGISAEKNPKITAGVFFERMGHRSSRVLLDKVARENGAQVIEPLDFLVENGFILAKDETGPIRFDDRHLRPDFVRTKIKYLDDIFSSK